MKEYTGFAEVYDMFMDNVPYDKWAKYLHKLLKENGAEKGIVCELGCGTGTTALRLASAVESYLAADISAGMIAMDGYLHSVAAGKVCGRKESANRGILDELHKSLVGVCGADVREAGSFKGLAEGFVAHGLKRLKVADALFAVLVGAGGRLRHRRSGSFIIHDNYFNTSAICPATRGWRGLCAV